MPRDGRLAAGLGGLSALLPLSIDMYLPCFAAMASSLNATSAGLAWSLPAFFVGLFVGQLTWGPLSDRYGRRRPMVIGLVGFVFSSLGCAFAPTLSGLVAMRLVQAFCGASGLVISRAIIRDCFEGRQAVQMLATLMLVQGVAPLIGPSLGDLVQSAVGWRGVFWLLAAMGLVLLLLCGAFVPETGQIRTETSLRPGALARRYFAILSDLSFSRYALSGALVGSALFVFLTSAPFVFTDLVGLTSHQFGLAFAANSLCLLLVGQSNRLLVRRYSPTQLLRAGLTLTLVGSGALWLAVWPHLHPSGLFVALPIFLCGLPLVWPNASSQALLLQSSRAGTAAGTYGALQWLCAALASSLTSSLHDGTARPMVAVMTMVSMGSVSSYVGLSYWARRSSRHGRPTARI